MAKQSPKSHARAKRTDKHAQQVVLTDEVALVVRTTLGVFGAVGLTAFSLSLASPHWLLAPWIAVFTTGIYLSYFYLHYSKRVREKKSIQVKFKVIFFAIISISVLVAIAISIHRGPARVLSNSSGPQLLIDARVRPFVPGESATVMSRVNNTGSKTAYNINVCAETTIEPSSFKGPLHYGTAPPDAEKTIPPMLPPKITALMVSTSRENEMVITDKLIYALINEKALFFFFGSGEYSDHDSRSYPIEFCFVYDPKMLNGQMATCPKQFWPKEKLTTNCPLD